MTQSAKTLSALVSAVLVLLLAGGCYGVKGTRLDIDTYCAPTEPGVLASDNSANPERNPRVNYKIGRHDKIAVHIEEHPEFSLKALRVESDGSLELPVLNKRLCVAGMTTVQAEALISETVAPFVVGEPVVKVRILQSRSRNFVVMGAVVNRGRYFMGLDDVTVRDALLNARLFRRGAWRSKVFVITPDAENKPTYIVLNGQDILLGDFRENVVLRPGDIVFVPTTPYHKVTLVLDEIIGQANRVQEMDTDVATYGKDAATGGFGAIP